MGQFLRTAILVALCTLLSTVVFAQKPETLIPGGNTIGLHVQTKGVSVVEFSGGFSKKTDIQKGDIIQKINGIEISTTQELKEAVQNSQGKALTLSLLRGEKELSCTLAPAKTQEGWQLGLLARDSLNGIGTVTYYNTENKTFGALGHGINDGHCLLPLKDGNVLPSQVASVTRGKKGAPGALQGAVAGRESLGEISRNTPQGIFGTMDCVKGTPLPVGEAEDIHTGVATILSNVRGTEVEEFTVRIKQISPEDSLNRNLLLEVTDPDLIAATGGIVQGMSGSPIIQDGKLIGAVTHVLLDDPTQGYGIFIENMLDAAA